MKNRLACLIAAPVLLAGCASTIDVTEPVRVRPEGQCDATGTQGWIGRVATSEMGAELLAATGARQLRWMPPRTASTMDFRPDRLTVSYDDTMTIDRIGCG